MRPRLNQLPTLMSCLLFGFSTHSFAENSDNATWQVQVGPVASVNTSFYQGVGEEYYLLPLVIAEYKRFYLQGIDAGYRFYQREDGQQLAVEIGRTFDGYESNDARFLSGMATRKAAWETRLVYEAIVGGGQLKGKLMQDISHSHEGFSAHLEYERPLWNDETHLVTWLAGGEYWDSKKTDYYFGVDASEARSNRVAYSASDSHNLFVGGNAIKQLTPKFSVMLNAEYRIASDAVKNSPLVSRNDQWSAYGGIFYEF